MTTPAGLQGRDLHVVERVLRGDAEVYRVLVERYRAQALAHAHVMTGDANVGEAAVDESFLMAFHALAKIPDRSNYRPFLFRALRKKLALPAESAHGSPAEDDDRDLLAGVLTDGLRNLNAADAIRRALIGLHVDLREAWSLRFVAGLPLEEIAELIGMEAGTAADRVREAEEALAQRVSIEGEQGVAAEAEPVTPTLDDVPPPVLPPELEVEGES